MTCRILMMALVLLVSCGRPLTEQERSFADTVQGETLNLDRVRLVEGAPVAPVTFYRKSRPRLACRERILPPSEEGIVTAKPAAVALFNRVYFTRDWYLEDYMSEFPEQMNLIAAMLLAHELTHVWQWQNRETTGYHPLRAAAEHGGNSDPYLFDLNTSPNFLSYGFEQQGAIVEEYVCCRALDPKAPRTQRIHDMLSVHFDLSPLPEQSRDRDIVIPWNGAKTEGICR
ncbi:hypothetical protein [Ruegeria profundi]|uniref:DUF4157 domain-containing protein n=1 Tax=Ruegeria profundi TaxID=1685378 RepID=A0A0X3TUJ7_9RHOB|nr:hypothetical protein [Ruegeria profundi]KUJ79402.1 hypothetical protein AVO44_09275 [Ruegeria profundi]MCA0928985.1 hypothetical protein [Ruegeria profundi]